MTAELLGGIAQRATSPYDVDELCRRAYPRRWDAALDEVAADPNVGVDPDPVLYDHSVSLHTVCGADAPDPSLAETDQVEASVRDWYSSVVPAATCLAAATFAHAFEWTSSDADRWDPAVTAYAHAEAYLSIHHLRQVTDAAIRH